MRTETLPLCAACRGGIHAHDRFTKNAPDGREGDDAGCPNIALGGGPCGCSVLVNDPHVCNCPTCQRRNA